MLDTETAPPWISSIPLLFLCSFAISSYACALGFPPVSFSISNPDHLIHTKNDFYCNIMLDVSYWTWTCFFSECHPPQRTLTKTFRYSWEYYPHL